MSAQTFPNSPMGLPSSLQFSLPPSMSDSARSYSVNVAPDGQTSVVGGTNTATPFVANSTGAFGNYTAQNISFTIPSGMSDSVFMDTTHTTVSFVLTYTVTGAMTGSVGASCNLIGSGASFIDTLTCYSNNQPLETINQYGLLNNFLLNNTVSASERYGGISVSLGADTNSYNGIDLATTAGTYRYSFCLPLLSVIGVNTTDKLFPVGSVNNLQLVLGTANVLPVVSYCTTVPTAQPVIGAFTLSEFQLNMKYIDVGDLSAQMLRQTLQNGKWYLRSSTYTNSSVNIPIGTNGAVQSLLQIRNTSVRSIFHQYGINASAVCPNGLYDAINPALTSRQCQIGGNFYPNRPLRDSQCPAEAYPYLIQSLGGGLTKSLGSMITRDSYNAVIPSVPAGSDSYCVVPAAGLRPAPTGSDNASNIISKFPNMAYYGYDLEKSAGILFQGVNTRASPPFLNTIFGVTSTSNITCQAWGLSDLVLEIDVNAKQITPYI